jgi:hypothetical protein
MNSALDFFDSHVSFIEIWEGTATVFFSHACIHKSKGSPGRDPGKVWSQEAKLVLNDVTVFGALPALPNTICGGFLEVGGIKHERLPLPFTRKVSAFLSLEFIDDSIVAIAGHKPHLELLGRPTFLEEFDQ